jgi:cell division protein FtsQ
MRSVSSRKPARKSRAKSGRRDTRKTGRMKTAKPAAPRRAFGRRTHFRDDIFARAYRAVRRQFSFRRPVLYLTGGLMALSGIVALFAGGYVQSAVRTIDSVAAAVSADAGFGISKLHLAGENRTAPQTILAVLNFKPGQSIFDADLRMARARLERLPWVARATVTRRYPDSVSVRLVEKQPFALWQSPKGLVVIERSGAVITKTRVKDFPNLPLFVGGAPEGGDELMRAVAAHRAIAARLAWMQRVSQRRWNLMLEGHVVVKLPETGWKKQLDVLENLIVVKGVLERDIKEIDLRSGDNYFFMLRGQKKPQHATRENAA